MPTSIQELIDSRSLIHHFQPVVSVKKRAVSGLEALARGLDGPLRLIQADQLFDMASASGVREALDELSCAEALKSFADSPLRGSMALFINLDVTRLARGSFSVGGVRKAVEEAGLKPQDVVLEFSDLEHGNAPGLRSLIETCQSFGFSVALDDHDASPEALRRCIDLRPNLLKADSHLIQGIATDPVQQALVAALVSVARRLGALTVAEGVENEEDAGACLELGVDMLQGFHYGRPQALERMALAVVQAGVERSAARVKATLAGRTQLRQRESERHHQLLERIRDALSASPSQRITPTLEQFVNAVASLECLYVLDPRGIQETPTIVWRLQRESQRSRLFSPAAAGADHSLKDYFLNLTLGGPDQHVSEPYVSLATGNLCRTLTTRFKDLDGAEHILCMDTRSS